MKTKRPRGRPKGSKNKPATLEAFMAECIALTEKPAPVRKKGPPKGPMKPREFYVEISRKAKLKKQEVNGAAPGQPPGWNKRDFLIEQQTAEQEALRIMKKMEEQGQLPEMDDVAKEAMLAVLVMMRQPGSVRDKHSLARTLLEYTKAKPTSKSDITVRTAEDFLDEIAESDGSGS